MIYVMIFSSIFAVFCLTIIGREAQAIPCDKPRKGHPLDTHRFYYCINLFPPNGGHVWVPSKCHEGMIFSPVLNMCVVTNADITQDYSVTQQSSSSSISEPHSPFHSTIQNIDKHNHYLTIPIIKILDKGLCETSSKKETESYINKDQILSEFSTNSQSFSGDYKNFSKYEENTKTNDRVDSSDQGEKQETNYSNLFYRNVTKPYNLQDSSNPKVSDNISLSNDIFQEGTSSSEIFTSSQVINNTPILLTKKIGKPIHDNKYPTYSQNTFEEHEDTSIDNNFEIHDALLSSSKIVNKIKTYPNFNDNNEVHHLIGHGNYYITVENYKSSILPLLEGGSLSVIPCTTGVRMPNITNCLKYYVCNVSASTVHSYTCPPYTAFNYYKRICEARELKLCQAKLKEQSRGQQEDDKNSELDSVIMSTDNIKDEHSNDSLVTPLPLAFTAVSSPSCASSGKFIDPTSSRHYILCVRSYPSSVLKSYKMECPNNSEFCASESICKHRKLCLS